MVLIVLFAQISAHFIGYYLNADRQIWNRKEENNPATGFYYIYGPYMLTTTYPRMPARRYSDYEDEHRALLTKLYPILAKRKPTGSRGIFAEALQRYPNLFPTPITGFWFLAPFIDIVDSQPRLYVEISNVGAPHSAVFLKQGQGFVHRQESLTGFTKLNSANMRLSPGADPLRVEEVRFEITGDAYIISGCDLFWEVITPAAIAEVLSSKVEFSNVLDVLDVLKQKACCAVLRKYVSADLTREELHDMCLQKKLFSKRFEIIVNAAHVVYDSEREDFISLVSRQARKIPIETLQASLAATEEALRGRKHRVSPTATWGAARARSPTESHASQSLAQLRIADRGASGGARDEWEGPAGTHGGVSSGAHGVSSSREKTSTHDSDQMRLAADLSFLNEDDNERRNERRRPKSPPSPPRRRSPKFRSGK